METNQKLVFSFFMAAIQLIRESRLRPRLMDSVYNFMNIGIMISPTPMRQVLKSQYGPEQGYTLRMNGNILLPFMEW